MDIKIIAGMAALCCSMLFASCKENEPQQDKKLLTAPETVEDMVSIDEMLNIEEIIGDSSLLNAKGDRAWKKLGKDMIRVKDGDRFYLRMKTRNGCISSVTYQYDDNN